MYCESTTIPQLLPSQIKRSLIYIVKQNFKKKREYQPYRLQLHKIESYNYKKMILWQ